MLVYHLYDRLGRDLGFVRDCASLRPGDRIALADGRVAVVVARTDAASSSSVEALLEVVVFRAGDP